ncbi:MAG: SAM-dependent methyltransferase [Microbacterium sp.]|nr:MAG: SAM-dependent methyltransferase [Microbacterium sp.]
MTWPFLYFPDDRLSHTELMSARLDGHVVEIGDAYMPADTIETCHLRAGSLRRTVGSQLALTHESAAWVHGAIDDPPGRHCVQRRTETRLHHVLDHRLRYRDLQLPAGDAMILGGVAVSTPTRTLADLVRDRVIHESCGEDIVGRLVRQHPELVDAAIDWFHRAGPVHHKRAALAYLSGCALTTR